MGTYTAKSHRGRRRHTPAPAPTWLALLAGVLVLAGILAPGPWPSILLSGAGVICSATFIRLHLRHTSWLAKESARAELDR